MTIKILNVCICGRNIAATINRQIGEDMIEETTTYINIDSFLALIDTSTGHTSGDGIRFRRYHGALRIGAQIREDAIRIHHDKYQIDIFISKLKYYSSSNTINFMELFLIRIVYRNSIEKIK